MCFFLEYFFASLKTSSITMNTHLLFKVVFRHYLFTSQPVIRPLPAAHHGEVCEDLSSYRVRYLTRPYYLNAYST